MIQSYGLEWVPHVQDGSGSTQWLATTNNARRNSVGIAGVYASGIFMGHAKKQMWWWMKRRWWRMGGRGRGRRKKWGARRGRRGGAGRRGKDGEEARCCCWWWWSCRIMMDDDNGEEEKEEVQTDQIRARQNPCPLAWGKWVLVRGKQVSLATCPPGK